MIRIILIALFLTFALQSVAEERCYLRIYLRDSISQKGIPDASAFFASIGEGAYADSSGYLEKSLPPGNYKLTFRHVEYHMLEIDVLLQRDTLLNLFLIPKARELSEVVISNRTEREKAIGGILAGRTDLNMESLSNLPKFLGTNDPLKILQLLPGVQTSGDGNSDLYIRGSDTGHNLVLWNDAPIYNSSHLLGFFSMFNPGHISQFSMHKAGMDANYGGRLSSLLTIHSPGSVPEQFSVKGSIGLISSQANVDIPLSKTSGLYLSGRTTYLGLIMQPILESTIDNSGKETPFEYEFQDANLTFLSYLTPKDKLTINVFTGSDALELEDREFFLYGKMRWSNLLGSINWQHSWENNGFMSLSLYTSRYKNKLSLDQNGLNLKLPSSIRDIGLRNEWHFHIRKINVNAGLEFIRHRVSPQQVIIDDFPQQETVPYYTNEFALFLQTDFRILPRLWCSPGIRYSGNLHTGKYSEIIYNSWGEATDSIWYSSGKKISSTYAPEPRISLRYILKENATLRFSYNRNIQYLNLVTISGVGFPTDFWVPASKNIPVQESDNLSLGYSKILAGNDFETSVDIYYRNMDHIPEYTNHISNLLNQQYILERNLIFGKGRAWGGEFFLKKNYGQLTGWVSYTLGWSRRKFKELNLGRSFPSKHDRRHDISLNINYRLNDKWDFSSVFVYATGNAFTMPEGMYMVGGNIIKQYGGYNDSRMPDYHRLDISANYWFFKTKKRESGLNFSIYNAYRRKNPLFLFVVARPSPEENDYVIIKKKYKRLYDIIPSVSWTFKF